MAQSRIIVTVEVRPYLIQNSETGHTWYADRGEALVYCTGDMLYGYNVFRSNGCPLPLTPSDLIRRPS